MKRIRAFLTMLLIFVSLFGTGCFGGGGGEPFYKGVSIDEYEPTLSVDGVTNFMFDQAMVKEFLDTYEYSDGKFYWDTEMNEEYLYLLEKMDRALMWLSYDEAEYELAKNYALECMKSYIKEEKVYNEYQFYIRALREPNSIFPSQCQILSYNDQKNTLIFMGICCHESKYPDVQYGLTDFGLYLETFFGDFYDFDV